MLHGAGIWIPTFALKSFVGKYTSTMEHMGMIMFDFYKTGRHHGGSTSPIPDIRHVRSFLIVKRQSSSSMEAPGVDFLLNQHFPYALCIVYLGTYSIHGAFGFLYLLKWIGHDPVKIPQSMTNWSPSLHIDERSIPTPNTWQCRHVSSFGMLHSCCLLIYP